MWVWDEALEDAALNAIADSVEEDLMATCDCWVLSSTKDEMTFDISLN